MGSRVFQVGGQGAFFFLFFCLFSLGRRGTHTGRDENRAVDTRDEAGHRQRAGPARNNKQRLTEKTAWRASYLGRRLAKKQVPPAGASCCVGLGILASGRVPLRSGHEVLHPLSRPRGGGRGGGHNLEAGTGPRRGRGRLARIRSNTSYTGWGPRPLPAGRADERAGETAWDGGQPRLGSRCVASRARRPRLSGAAQGSNVQPRGEDLPYCSASNCRASLGLHRPQRDRRRRGHATRYVGRRRLCVYIITSYVSIADRRDAAWRGQASTGEMGTASHSRSGAPRACTRRVGRGGRCMEGSSGLACLCTTYVCRMEYVVRRKQERRPREGGMGGQPAYDGTQTLQST